MPTPTRRTPMKTSIPKSLTLLACLAATALVNGCGKSSPTAPKEALPPVPTAVMHTDVRFDYLVVMNDGDFIGDGEFEFLRGVNGVNTVSSRTMRTDDVWTINKRQTVNGEGSLIDVGFQASEWDRTILGDDVRDSDMDRLWQSKLYHVTAGLGGQYSTTLGNSACKVKLYYSLITYSTTE